MSTSPAKQDRAPGFVSVRGAREHNLRNVDVDVPRDALVVFTGISGSGKSSLAFGTIYAEAQRRYFESVAPYARRLIEQVGAPDVDSIEGLPPAVALQQQRGTPDGALLGRQRDDDLEPAAHALFARRHVSAAPGDALRRGLLAQHAGRRVPEVPRPRPRLRRHGGSMVPDDILTIRERADRRVAAGLARPEPARHPDHARPRRRRALARAAEEGARLDPLHRRAADGAGLCRLHARRSARRARRKVEPSYMGTFTGARRYVLNTFATTESALIKKRVSPSWRAGECPLCHGKRLKRAALSVTFAGLDIGDAVAAAAGRARRLLRRRPASCGASGDERERAWSRADAKRAPSGASQQAGRRTRSARRAAHADLSEEKRSRRSAWPRSCSRRTLRLGLGYLSLERSTPTLSPGELQRLRLATQVRSQAVRRGLRARRAFGRTAPGRHRGAARRPRSA